MATTITADAARFSIGGVISRAVSVLGRRFLMFFGLGLVAEVPELIVNYISLPTVNPAGSAAAFGASHWLAVIGGALLGLIMTALLQGSITYGTVMDLSDQPLSFGTALATALRVFFPLLGLTLIVAFGVGLALLLLIVPGIMLGLAWNVAVPVRVVEQTSVFGAFGRSRGLTAGHRWAILGLWVIYFVAAVVVQLVVRFAVALPLMNGAHLSLALLINWLVQALMAVVAATIGACIYFELRSEKEGIGPQQLAAVFD